VKNELFKVVSVFLACLSFFACSSESNTVNHGVESLDAASQDIGSQPSVNKSPEFEHLSILLQLPDEVDVKYFSQVNESDSLTRAVLLLSEDDFLAWIAKFDLEFDRFENDKRYLLGPNLEQWNPNSPKELPTGQVQFENGMFLNIGYTNAINQKVRTYIMFHGT